MTQQFVRTANGCYTMAETYFGYHAVKIPDPEGIEIEDLHSFKLKEIERIPAGLWSAWVQLCFHFAEPGIHSEVSIRILKDAEDNWRFLVPRQKVSGASVRVDDFSDSIDIITGETFDQYPPEGWTSLGSSHSHNTMHAFFSATDDASELTDPGLHIVVGSIRKTDMKYAIVASVTAAKKRHLIQYESVLDAEPVSGSTFHPDVLNYAVKEVYTYKPATVSTGAISGLPVKSTTSWFDKSDTSVYDTRYRYSDDYELLWNRSSSFADRDWHLTDLCTDVMDHLKRLRNTGEICGTRTIETLAALIDDLSEFYDEQMDAAAFFDEKMVNDDFSDIPEEEIILDLNTTEFIPV